MAGSDLSAGEFTAGLWKSIDGIYSGVLDHPFLKGLSDGTLPREKFRHYAVQDSLYLRRYSRALALVGVRSQDDDTVVMFDEHSRNAILVERSLHEGFFQEMGLNEDEVQRAEMAPTTLAYTSHMLSTCATGSYPEALCSVLPCYWIYAEVGKALSDNTSPDPIYDQWISTYGGEEFESLVRAVLAVTERACSDLDPRTKESAEESFHISSRYEWMFWDMGWRLEGWPV